MTKKRVTLYSANYNTIVTIVALAKIVLHISRY